MIVRFAKAGASFKGVAQDLTHDAGRAESSERVAWTHTLNLAQDHVPSAVDEMLWTARSAEFLKQEAGVRGGSTVEKPVKHLSLNWHPSEQVDRAEMVRATESFLQHMRWQEHQCLLVCHTDRHPHVHLVINMIHPETGRRLDDAFERRRAQQWALGYEQERGTVLCPQRLKPVAEREVSAPRPVWKLLEEGMQAHLRAETARMADAPEAHQARMDAERLEWKILKEIQKEERLAFFEEGRVVFKALRNDVYRKVSRGFKSQWAELYSAKRAGAHPADLAAIKADLVERQREVLVAQRDAACASLRLERDREYVQLLDRQKVERGSLQQSQERNVASIDDLYRMAEAGSGRAAAQPPATELGEAEEQVRRRARASERQLLWSDRAGLVPQERSAMRFLDKVAQRARASPAAAARQGQAIDRLYGKKAVAEVASERRTGKDEKALDPDPD